MAGFNKENKLTTKELAGQLRKPDGDLGKDVGLQMNKGNKYICLNSYKVLNPKNEDCILEIGMGNGFFVKDLLAISSNLKYVGVDFSETMIQEANLINKTFINTGVVKFQQASIEELPFEDNTFDCITTTNTLYFWPQPEENIKELLRVLKPEGKLLVAYRLKELMDKIELSQYGFEKYDIDNVENLFEKSGFKTITTEIICEPELEFDGKLFQMKGAYSIGYK